MHATSMHFAFVRAADTTTSLGKRVLSMAVKHHEVMETELKRMNAKERIRREVSTSTTRKGGEKLADYFLRLQETTVQRYREEGLLDEQ